jgi:site-specific recombinase XerD
MMIPAEPASVSSSQAGPLPDQLRLTVAAYLARFKGSSREHTESDLRCYLAWCAERDLDPLTAQRLHLELYIRWMQETRKFKPSTICRRFSVTAGFYRTCAIGKGTKIVLVPLPPAVGWAIDRAVAGRAHGPVLLNSRGARMDRHAATRRLRRLAESVGIQAGRTHPHMLRHTFVTTMLDAGVDLRDVQIAACHADPRTTMRYDRARQNLDRHPNYILAAFMASGT